MKYVVFDGTAEEIKLVKDIAETLSELNVELPNLPAGTRKPICSLNVDTTQVILVSTGECEGYFILRKIMTDGNTEEQKSGLIKWKNS